MKVLIFKYSKLDERYINSSGNDTKTGDLNFDGAGISTTDYVDFNTSYSDGHAEGRAHWDDDSGTVEIGMKGGTVKLQVGQEQLIRCKASEAISNGEVVYVDGADGANPTVSLAQADTAPGFRAVGMATEDIGSGQQGYITTQGLVRDIDTNSFTAGDTLYLSGTTAGGVQNTLPDSDTYFAVVVGHVVRKSVDVGEILVNMVHFPDTNHIYQLDSWGDERYVNITGDTMTGALTIGIGTYSEDSVAQIGRLDYSLAQYDNLNIAVTDSNQVTVQTNAVSTGGYGLGPDFLPHDLTSNISNSPIITSASSEWSSASKALDNPVKEEANGIWLGQAGLPAWWKIDLGSGNEKRVYSYDIWCNEGATARDPKDWLLEGSNNDSDWDTVDTVTGEINWTKGETRNFVTSVNNIEYRYYRISISANNGDSTYVGFNELWFYEAVTDTTTPSLILGAGANHITILPNGNVGIGTEAPLAQLHTTQGRIKKTTRVTTTYTILVTDDTVFANTDGGDFTVTLPVGVDGQTFRVINSGAGILSIIPDGTEELLGENSSFNLSENETLLITYESTDGWM